ncbi:hypothetical protein [Crateriforma conspicua]|uniref:DUF4350 domain-containing protein n=1 Tax=Crateriforma conspicua TaxID=2527996 RepID=A0A5C6FQ23_9PLAN|nr:hypothetical protein [Crateriforma conspicua]TWU65222.1 hypothetical protein V7x_07680 [Crateriforma conspicua]
MTGRLLIAVVCLACWTSLAMADVSDPASSDVDQGSGSMPATAADSVGYLSVGIQGRYRLGRWTAVRLAWDRTTVSGGGAADDSWSLQTPDADGVPVRYRVADATQQRWGYVIPTGEAAPLDLFVNDEPTPSATTRFPYLGAPAKEPSLVPESMPWVVAIGDPLDVDTIGANELLNREAQLAVCSIQDADDLPDRSLGWSGVDLLMINASGVDVLTQLSESQQNAIVQWVRTEGGNLFLCLGERSKDVIEASPWLNRLLPQALVDADNVTLNPAALETFTNSQSPLDAFDGIRIPGGDGFALITGRTNRRVAARMAVEYFPGFGHVTVIAADLDTPMFQQWPDRLDLIKRLMPQILEDSTNETNNNQVAGFSDLAGQTRSTLDQFSVKRSFGFSVLSLILMGLILLIGPIDYLVINRLVGRPLLGWVTMPLVAILFSVVLVYQARQVSPASSANTDRDPDATTTASSTNVGKRNSGEAWNHLEITDIDLATRSGRGMSWSVLYSHDGGIFDIDVNASDALKQTTPNIGRFLCRPWGQAGREFGGIQIESDTGLPPYTNQIQIASSPPDDSVSRPMRSELELVGIAPRSSKSFGAGYTFDFAPDGESMTVRRRKGSDLLQGDLVNPLPVDLLDGMLVYRNWAYRLPTRLPAGGRIERLDELRQENFRWHLTRQKTLESNSDAQPWDGSDFDNLPRVTEMLMFHDVVGGSRYTGLTHGPLGQLDASRWLVDDRCVLIARLADPMTDVSWTPAMTSETQTAPANTIPEPQRGIAMVRVVIPVQSQ